MESMIHHFKQVMEGLRPPVGEAYVAVESPKGELGYYMVSRRHGQAGALAHPSAVVREPLGDSEDGAKGTCCPTSSRSTPASTS